MKKDYRFAHGSWLETEVQHDSCPWCRQALETGTAHMRDATLKDTKSTKTGPLGDRHTATLKRVDGSLNPQTHSYVTLVNGTAAWTGRAGRTYNAAVPQPERVDMSDKGLSNYAGREGASLADRQLIAEIMNLRIKLSRQRPVVFDVDEGEAGLLLNLLDLESEEKTTDADEYFQNGEGFEAECVQARALAEEAEKLATRLRKLVSRHLNKAYKGEL